MKARRIALLLVLCAAAGVPGHGGYADTQAHGPVASSSTPKVMEKPMNETLRVNLVLGIRDGRVDTDRSGTLTCPDPDMLRDLASYHARREPVSIAFDEAARQITAVGSAPTDVPLAVASPDSHASRIAVHLMKRPSLLYLDRSHPRFAELHALLVDARAGRARVAIGVLPGGQSIEDVRLEDWNR